MTSMTAEEYLARETIDQEMKQELNLRAWHPTQIKDWFNQIRKIQLVQGKLDEAEIHLNFLRNRYSAIQRILQSNTNNFLRLQALEDIRQEWENGINEGE